METRSLILSHQQYAQVSTYDLLCAAEQGFVALDHRFLHAIVDDPQKSIRDLLRFGLVEGAGFINQLKEGAAAVVEMGQPMFNFRGAEGVDIKTNMLAVAAVFVLFQHADLIEGAAEVRAAKRFVLVEFQAVLVVEMEGPKFAESHRTKNFSVKGAPAEPSVQARTVFQVVYADGYVMVDSGMDQQVHSFFGRGWPSMNPNRSTGSVSAGR